MLSVFNYICCILGSPVCCFPKMKRLGFWVLIVCVSYLIIHFLLSLTIIVPPIFPPVLRIRIRSDPDLFGRIRIRTSGTGSGRFRKSDPDPVKNRPDPQHCFPPHEPVSSISGTGMLPCSNIIWQAMSVLSSDSNWSIWFWPVANG
jgi:hypothetical protein